MAQSTASTRHQLSMAGDVLAGYCLLWRDKNNPDANGHWYTANSLLGISELEGSDVVMSHEELGGMLKIGSVATASPDYYGVYIEADVLPKHSVSLVQHLLMTEKFHLAIATDEHDQVEIGGDGFVINYPITAIVLLPPEDLPITGQ
jgi:hypothetical protein